MKDIRGDIMSRTRAERRFLDYVKACRKRKICLEVYLDHQDLYNNLHQYSKNKIHCSCPFCSEKTNNRGRYGSRRVWPITDQKRIEEMEYEVNELD